MFSKKIIKEIRETVFNHLTFWQNYSKLKDRQLENMAKDIEQIKLKVIPTPIPPETVHTIDAYELATKLRRFSKRKMCGMGNSCSQYYLIPADVLDRIKEKDISK